MFSIGLHMTSQVIIFSKLDKCELFLFYHTKLHLFIEKTLSNSVVFQLLIKKTHQVTLQQRGYSLYIEGHTLRTTMVLRQIGCSGRHFRRYVASPAPSPDRDKTIEFRSIDH